MVSTSASIWVGCQSSVRPLKTGTPACAASSSTMAWRVAAVLDPVEHPAQHPRGVLDRLLVPDLRAGRVEVGRRAPWSAAATSKAQRVRVEVFSKISAMFRPRAGAPRGLPLAAFSSAASSIRPRNSAAVKSVSRRRLRWCRAERVLPAVIARCCQVPGGGGNAISRRHPSRYAVRPAPGSPGAQGVRKYSVR